MVGEANYAARAAFGAGAMALMAGGGMVASSGQDGSTRSIGTVLGIAGGLGVAGGVFFDMAMAVERSPFVLLGAGAASAAALLVYAGLE